MPAHARRFPAAVLPTAVLPSVRLMNPAARLRGIAVEAAWTAAQAAMYPGGFFRERVRSDSNIYNLGNMSPLQRGLLTRDAFAAGTPILLLHGMIGNRSSFVVLRRVLRRRGFQRVITINYQVVTQDIRQAAQELGRSIEVLCEANGHDQVHVVGHSLGGIIARYYIQRLGGDARVHTLVTLGSPHQGTRPAGLVPHAVGRQIRPDSDLILELAQAAPGCATRFLAFWCDLDALMIPKRAARIVHPDLDARNVFVRGVGHMSLLVDGGVAHQIAAALGQLDPADSAKPPARRPQTQPPSKAADAANILPA
ncbi:MAG: alpha/beta fold hydrolase [Frankiaceae bacterium]